MGVVIVDNKLTENDIKTAREDYGNVIKITTDIEQEIAAIGGEYHHDAEQILIRRFKSKNSNLWGGAYYIDTKILTTNAYINYKSNLGNPSNEILSEQKREEFLKFANKIVKEIESLL